MKPLDVLTLLLASSHLWKKDKSGIAVIDDQYIRLD
jgi:hypothetical protein